MQYLLMIYRNEAELGKMDATARQKMTAEYGAFTQSIIQGGNFKAENVHLLTGEKATLAGMRQEIDTWLPELANRRVLKSISSQPDDTVPALRAVTVRDLLGLGFDGGFVLCTLPSFIKGQPCAFNADALRTLLFFHGLMRLCVGKSRCRLIADGLLIGFRRVLLGLL